MTDPIEEYRRWQASVVASKRVRYPEAACLSTVDENDEPDSRVILVHFVDLRGAFVFSTDQRSAKVGQLTRQPRAALSFDWSALDRQVRVRGVVEPADDRASDRCFEERPRGSRITAWASHQSQKIEDPRQLTQRYATAAARLSDTEPVPRPATWRAYRLQPSEIELWQARRHRLHDRRRFVRTDTGWRVMLLEP